MSTEPSLHLIGINHKTADIATRELVATDDKNLGTEAAYLKKELTQQETVLISTCNRTEIYTIGEPQAILDHYRQKITGQNQTHDPAANFYTKKSIDAIAHLIAVASGVDSMVLGETEVFGQVKRAYEKAVQNSASGRLLNRLFQSAFSSAKHIRTHTAIQRGATSIGNIAVRLAEQIFGKLDNRTALILGAGDVAQTTLQAFASHNIGKIKISNRSADRAATIATKNNASVIPFADWAVHMADTDIFISSTAAPGHIVDAKTIAAAQQQRRHRPLLLIDLAMPRDIDSNCRDIEGVYLYDIDALQEIAMQGRRLRKNQLELCNEIIAEHSQQIWQRLTTDHTRNQ